MVKNCRIKKIFFLVLGLVVLISAVTIFFSGCASGKLKNKISYFIKTEPEKAAIDFINALKEKNPERIYDSFLKAEDKENISKEKFISELNIILNDIEDISIKNTIYLGYEKEFAKVVAEFEVKYVNGEKKEYKKYIYLVEENKIWKIVFDKTFF